MVVEQSCSDNADEYDESLWHTRLPLHLDNNDNVAQDKELHIAPMLDVSNREFRQFMRILSKRCVLWTEMVVDETIRYTKRPLDVYLGHDEGSHPIVCQIGGNSPEYCANATQIVEQQFQYDEVNFNIDCPSDRVSGKREFGAVLMKKVDTAVAVMEAIQESATDIPVSVKCRIGIDDHDNLDYVVSFIQRLKPHCRRFYLHARKCVLGGLSPAQNRIVPPLNYPRIYLLCTLFPDCDFWINGGIPGLKIAKELCYGSAFCQQDKSVETSANVSAHVVPCGMCGANNGSCTIAPPVPPSNLKGCMLGRAARDLPGMFWDVDRYFYGEPSNPCQTRREALDKYCTYLERMYPRRCCDSNAEPTKCIPAPVVEHEYSYCSICKPSNTDQNHQDGAEDLVAPNDGKQKSKVTIHVMSRALQPVLGLFHGLSQSRHFRRTCDKLRYDTSVRNCGPAFILRRVMESVSDELLDQSFVRTEDLTEDDVPVHVAPADDCCLQREKTLARRQRLQKENANANQGATISGSTE